jgi:phosphoglycolate phosphatase-like HAD superfamily hydrolase
VKKEIVLLQKNVLLELRRRGVDRWGIITGRDPQELGLTLGRLPFDGGLSREAIVTFPTFKKPDPGALRHVARALRTGAGLFVGDNPEDLLLVQHYCTERSADDPPFLSVTVKEATEAAHFRSLGTDATIEHVRELPELIDRLSAATAEQGAGR